MKESDTQSRSEGREDPVAEVDALDEELAHTRMTFGQHLEELRRRLGRSVVVTLVGMVVAFIWHRELLEFISAPYSEAMAELDRPGTLHTGTPQGAFFGSVKVALVTGIAATSPFWISQIWAFIAAGLYAHERKAVTKLVPLCVVLFLGGMVFGYTALLPYGLDYLLGFGDPALLTPLITLSSYLSIFTSLTLLLGLAFQLPVVMVGVARAGMLDLAGFRSARKYVIVGLFVLAALLTPPDPVTQILLAMPLALLYEVGILLAWFGMGSERPAFDWKATRGPFLKLGAVLAVLLIFQGPLRESLNSFQIEGRTQNDAENQTPIVGMLTQVLGTPLDWVYRLESAELELAPDGDTANEDVRFLALAKDGRVWVLLHSTTTERFIPGIVQVAGQGGGTASVNAFPVPATRHLFRWTDSVAPRPGLAALRELLVLEEAESASLGERAWKRLTGSAFDAEAAAKDWPKAPWPQSLEKGVQHER